MIVQAPYSQYIQGWIRPFLAAWAKCSSADRKRAGWELGPLIWRWIAAGKFSPKTDKVLDAATHRPSPRLVKVFRLTQCIGPPAPKTMQSETAAHSEGPEESDGS